MLWSCDSDLCVNYSLLIYLVIDRLLYHSLFTDIYLLNQELSEIGVAEKR